ncbi:MAG: hypothetical protein ACODAC_07515 [Pseudomonadota bacterium]
MSRSAIAIVVAAAVNTAAASVVPNPVDGLGVAALLNDLDVTTRHRAADEPLDDDSPGAPHLLGVEANVPGSLARTSVEYALLAPQSHRRLDSGNDYTMFRAQLDTRWRFAELGVRYFSVGEAFAGEALGSRRLSEVGLGATGEGAGAWASMALRGFTLEPRVAQVTRPLAGGEEAHDRMSLVIEREVGDLARVLYAYEARTEQTAVVDRPGREDDVDRHRLRLASSGWRLDWTRQERDMLAPGNAREGEASLEELAASFPLSGRLCVTPLVSREQVRRSSEPATVRDRGRLSLRYETTWQRLPSVDLQLGYRGMVRGERQRRVVNAGVSFRAYLGGEWYPRHRTWLGVSLGYQHAHGGLGAVPDEGMEVELTFEHHPGR